MRSLKKISLAGFCLLILTTLNFAGTWRKQNSGTLAWLHSIYFLDSQRGWIAGSNGTLLTTVDGGATWKAADKPTEDNVQDVFFTNRNDGWLLCARDFHKLRTANEARSYLLRTSNGGVTWERVNLPVVAKTTPPQITKFIVSSDRQTAWAVGETGAAYTLDREGEGWRRQPSPTRYLLRGGAFFNDREGTVIGAGATILNTSDGGKIWREALIPNGENPRFNSVFYVARNLGWAVGAEGKIFATTNGGKSWKLQTSTVQTDLLDVRFTSERDGWAVGDRGTLLQTTTGGASWTAIQTSAAHRLERIFFTAPTRGWAVGFGGTILSYDSKTSNQPILRR